MSDAEHPYKVDTCSSCKRPIIWALTAKKLARMPVDADPPQTDAKVRGNVHLEYRKGAAPLAHVLNATQQFGKTGLRLPHFATCPDAGAWHRQPKGRPARP